MANIRKSLIQFVFNGAYMKRWNDKLRPMEFIEADKQAHKMIIAWILCQLAGSGMDWREKLELEQEVIERAMFDYFLRLVITDIKPPVFYRIKKNPNDYLKLARWVIAELEPNLSTLDLKFWERLQAYLLSPDSGDLPAQILDAAHHYASGWELSILRGMNGFDPEMPEIVADFIAKLERHQNLKGFSVITGTDFVGLKQVGVPEQTALGAFAKLCGQLRFQKRWSQTPRIPETSVMGHMFFVACYAYFFSLAVEAGAARRVNNFFCALFHDLPELLTRDIISPVKNSVSNLDALIREYEGEELKRRVFAPLWAEGYEGMVERLGYYLGVETGSEFHESVILDGKVTRVEFEDLQTKYNDDRYDPKDGKLLKICDHLAAFVEAYTATRNGINADELQQAIWRTRNELLHTSIGPVHVGALLADFA